MHNFFRKLSSPKSCANAIEAFHRTLGGRMFKHENKGYGGNVACPIISKCTLGLRPSPATPQFNKNKRQFKDKSLTFQANTCNLEHKNISMESQRAQEWGTYLLEMNNRAKWNQKREKWWPRLQKLVILVASFFNEGGWKNFWCRNLPPSPFLPISCRGCSPRRAQLT